MRFDTTDSEKVSTKDAPAVKAWLSRRQFLGSAGASAFSMVGAGVLLSACGSSSGGGAPSAASHQAGRRTLAMGLIGEPDTLDPGASGLAESDLICWTMFDPLVWSIPAKGGARFHPGLATHYSVSSDATVYTFELRKDVTFHDGTHFDAEAVKATLQHIFDPKTKSTAPLASLPSYKETRVLDRYKVAIVFSEPNASVMAQIATVQLGMSSPAALKKYGPTGFGSHPVGTGPFKFVEYEPQSHVTVERNPDYRWGPAELFGSSGPAKLEKITFRLLQSATTSYSALQAGQLQMAKDLAPNDIHSIRTSNTFATYNAASTGVPYGYPINVTKAPTTDPRVRQALQYAVDQDALVKKILFDAYTPAHSVLTPSTSGYNPRVSSMYTYNPQKAAAMLDAAGWTQSGGGSRKKGGQELTLEILLLSETGFDLATEFVVENFKTIGIGAKTTDQPSSTAFASYNKGVQNLSSIFLAGVSPYILNDLLGSSQIKSGFNWSHFSDPKVDRLLKQANSTADTAKSAQLYQQVGEIAMKEAVFLPLWNLSFLYGAVKNLHGVRFTVNGLSLFTGAEFV